MLKQIKLCLIELHGMALPQPAEIGLICHEPGQELGDVVALEKLVVEVQFVYVLQLVF